MSGPDIIAAMRRRGSSMVSSSATVFRSTRLCSSVRPSATCRKAHPVSRCNGFRRPVVANVRSASSPPSMTAPDSGRCTPPRIDQRPVTQVPDYMLENLAFVVQEIQTDKAPKLGTSFNNHLR